MMRLLPLAAAMAVLAASCAPSVVNTDPVVTGLIERIGLSELQRSPEQAGSLGVSTQVFGKDYSALLDDRSIAATEHNRVARVAFLHELESVDRSTLSRTAIRQLDTALQVMDAAVRVDRHGYGYVNLGWASPYLINQSDGAYTDLVKALTLRRAVRSRADAQAWLARLALAPQAIIDEQRRFEIDVEAGAAPPRAILQRTLDKVRALTPSNAHDNTLIQFFTEQLSQIPDLKDDDIRAMTDQAAKTIEQKLVPAYRDLEKALEATLKTAADEPGVWRLKDGEAYYRDALHLYTSTDLSPKDVHALGLKLVDDISKQMDDALNQLNAAPPPAPATPAVTPAAAPPKPPAPPAAAPAPAAGKPATPAAAKPPPPKLTVGERMAAMARDPAYLYPATEEGHAAMLAALQSHIDWGMQHMAHVASLLPSRPVELRQAPEIVRDTAPGAYYRPGSLDGVRPATYNLNLGDGRDWPMWMLPTLTYHETIPGHHIQSGLARERWSGQLLSLITSWPAFSEGWGVYAEDLADEMGAYKDDPRARLGYLQSLLFRAARLVTDTGIHSEKWTRQQAVDYLVQTTGLPRASMENEVDRYTIWPGQACAYMIGRETIRRLRNSADKELAASFDLKAFHDVVLNGGGRPLPILESDIHDWVISRKQAPAAK